MILMDGEDKKDEKKIELVPLTNLYSEETCTGLAVRARHLHLY
jgi:hypothetical protein